MALARGSASMAICFHGSASSVGRDLHDLLERGHLREARVKASSSVLTAPRHVEAGRPANGRVSPGADGRA